MDNQSLIDNYFEGTLNPDEKTLFNRLVKSDPDFAKQVNFQKNVKIALTLKSREELKSQLKEHEKSLSKQRIFNRKWLAIAASIIILFGLFFIFQSTPDSSDLYAKFFSPYPNTVAPIVRGENENSKEMRAFKAYELEKYDKSAKLFNDVFLKENKEYIRFYEAISLMADEQFSSSELILRNYPWLEYSEKANWYLALNYLQSDQKENAKKLLIQIKKENSYKAKSAKKLLHDLK